MNQEIKKLHPLFEQDKKHGQIIFIHTDNKEHKMTYGYNRLSGDFLAWFDNEPPSVFIEDISKDWIKNIKAKSIKVISHAEYNK
jgi:hypothetical protein